MASINGGIPQTAPCDHLFIAMVGNVGSGVSTSANIMKEQLERTYGYQAVIIRVSDLIKSSKVGRLSNLDSISIDEKVEAYQNCGNELREKFGDSYLARRCISVASSSITNNQRFAFIFDSFKHPSEIAVLKQCYEERLLTFTVFCPARLRKTRLAHLGLSDPTIDRIFDRDEFELDPHGQKVRDTAYLSDFFIRNSADNTVELKNTINRYLEIIFSSAIHSPTFDETGMAKAFGASVNSACMSRQVGAAVYDADRKLLATGCNDVPKFGGGLYGEDRDLASDNRCYNWKEKICHNDAEKEKIYNEIMDSLFPNRDDLKARGLRERIIDRIKKTRVRDLIEFSRSVHAEMDAIVSVSRHGTGSTLDGTLFSKTFPCHNCARHIVASGIKRVVFVEPYPKSLALKLHSDSITVKDEDAEKAVFFVQYEGVSPKVFSRFFGADSSRKLNGKVITVDPRTCRPNGLSHSASYLHEAQILMLPEPQGDVLAEQVQ